MIRHNFAVGLLSISIFICGCEPAASFKSFKPSELTAFKNDTGLPIPDSAEVLNYSSGWDERFLKLRMARNDVASFVASYPVQPVEAYPQMDGMEPSNVSDWWHPREFRLFKAYNGQFTWKTRAGGGVSVLVDDGKTERPIVYVYVFKA